MSLRKLSSIIHRISQVESLLGLESEPGEAAVDRRVAHLGVRPVEQLRRGDLRGGEDEVREAGDEQVEPDSEADGEERRDDVFRGEPARKEAATAEERRGAEGHAQAAGLLLASPGLQGVPHGLARQLDHAPTPHHCHTRSTGDSYLQTALQEARPGFQDLGERSQWLQPKRLWPH